MSETELEILRLKVQIEAARVLIRALYISLANTAPNGPQRLRDQFARLREEHQKIAIEGIAPEYSDLVAGEYQDALDDLLTSIESKLRA